MFPLNPLFLEAVNRARLEELRLAHAPSPAACAHAAGSVVGRLEAAVGRRLVGAGTRLLARAAPPPIGSR